VIVAIQLIILGVIIFFPETTKRRLFSEYKEISRPDIAMQLLDDEVDDTVQAIDDAGLFERYRWTRAVGVETPQTALLVLPDYNFAQYWHFESFLVAAHEAGFGALILDLKDVPEFVPIKSKDGILRSTDERMQIFTDAALKWLYGIGFKEIALVSFGTGTQSALDIIERSPPDTFTAWVDISGIVSSEKLALALSTETAWPPVYFISGSYDRNLSDRKHAIHTLSSNGFETRHKIVEPTGTMLLNEEGNLDPEIEANTFQTIFDWTQ